MTIRLLFALSVLAMSLQAELQVFNIDNPPSEDPVGSQLDFGVVPSGDRVEIKLRLRNTGATTVSLQRLRVTGTGFTLRNNPSLPHVVAAGGNVDFRIRFEPKGFGGYSGSLRVNDDFVFLLASVPATISVAVNQDELWEALTSGDTVIFGRALPDEDLTRRFRLTNPSRGPLELDLVTVSGPDFRLESAPATPLSMSPGDSLEFAVAFAPQSAGIKQASLTVNNRVFVLEGVGLHPPFPPLEIELESNALTSAQQASVRVRLTEPSPADGAGTLQMSFTPGDPGVGDDPAVLFVNGERAVAMTVAQGETTALLEGSDAAWFQTGTTAGEIRFAVELGERRAEAGVTLPPAAVAIDSGGWSQTQTGIELRVNGFDNTRTVSSVAFHFFDTNGQPLTPDPMSVNVANSFRGYFSSNQVGGVFALGAEFPVAGDTSLLGAATIQFVNNNGPSAIHRIEFK